MKISQYEKMQRSIERAKKAHRKAKERKRDIQDLKDAGIWNDPRTLYLDEDGYVLPDAPQWWRNLRKAWITNDMKVVAAKSDLVARREPAVKKGYKKVDRNPKLKHSIKMKLLLEDHGINVDQNSMLSDEFSDWKFCVNGRLQRGSEPTISVFYFLQHRADIELH